MKIWLDDIREPPDKSWIWADSADSFEDALHQAKRECLPIEVISYDHDLGDKGNAVCGDGYSAIKMTTNVDFCEVYPLEVRVHSANPVGAENIRQYDAWFRRMRREAFDAMEEA